MMTTSALFTIALRGSRAGVARCTLFDGMQPDRPGPSRLVRLLPRPPDRERKPTEGHPVGTRHHLGKIGARRFGQQHDGLVATAFALAMAHAGARQALDQILAALSAWRERFDPAAGPHVSGPQI